VIAKIEQSNSGAHLGNNRLFAGLLSDIYSDSATVKLPATPAK